jgi:nucleoside-diphosphate-sugar epimerase
MKVLLTGARGFLGQHVLRALVAAGHSVRALDRAPGESAQDIEPVQLDLCRDELSPDLFARVDCLIHLAAALQGPSEAIRADTVTGTHRLLEAMTGTACQRIVLLSSLSVYDWSKIRGLLDEASPLLNDDTMQAYDGYAQAKALQERLVRQIAGEQGWTLTVLRPAVLYREERLTALPVGHRLGPLQLVFSPLAKARIAHVDRVVEACLSHARRADGRVATFNVIDPPQQSVWSYARKLGGLPVPIPYLAWRGFAALAFGLTMRSDRLPYFLQPSRFDALHKPVCWRA